MLPERWEEVKQLIKKQYEVSYEGTETLENSPGQVEVLEFVGPLGEMRVEYVTKPKTLNTKVYKSRRVGSEAREEVIYSNKEVVQYLKVYTCNDQDEWQEVKSDIFK